ncbi:hypothetical protein JI721_12340 [Alicyclobacillus cycloheptanicus]|uniref:Uncharacterized protein n=1 Tax=Alicyclobacillus cycloheptanicus TaxID=1457 RepID=A0ABT9XFF7_9BACL|nr:hypothetical protein [Alicyclobacillus cycloheptanicus]MDQ0188855.1 hypothetical protein [Alicyclobacillus cycloheptanicus]WDM00499.1 hypothetical protein JI721_12340 [Alicyclobacillus cycloheptanicus]
MTDSDLQQQMNERKATHDEAARHRATLADQQKDITQETKNAMHDLLHQFADDALQNDEHLAKQPTPVDSVSVSIAYENHSNLVPLFQVTAACHEDQVDISITDGHWEDVPGLLGNWGNWTDQTTVYAGPFDAHRIRKALESAFLKWYDAALNIKDQWQ